VPVATVDPESSRDPLSGQWTRPGQLLALLGLTGFAISQPLLSLTGDDPSLFTQHNVDGTALLVYVLAVALLPPLAMWAVVVVVGRVNRRAGDILFLVLAAALAALTLIQALKSADISNGIVLGVAAVAMALVFAGLLLRVRPAYTWVRFTAPLPLFAVVLFVVASPSGDLMRSANGAAAQTSGDDVSPLVFILLDQFPTLTLLDEDRGIDPVRFPNLAELSEAGTWYRNYTVNAPSTPRSIPALLSSQTPNLETPLWTNFPDSIFSLLAPTHELEVSEESTKLCGFTDCPLRHAADNPDLGGLIEDTADVWVERISLGPTHGQDFGQFQEELSPADVAAADDGPRDFGAAVQNFEAALRAYPVRFKEFHDSLRVSSRPDFFYLHLLSPHLPWIVYPDGREYATLNDGMVAANYGEAPPSAAVRAWGLAIEEQRHTWQAQHADRLVGETMARLREIGLYDDATIVITSDHGITLDYGPQGLEATYSLTPETVDSMAYVPLIVKRPGQQNGGIDDTNLMGVDLLPTVADAVGVNIDFPVEGHPAGSPELAARGDEKFIHAFSGEIYDRALGIVRFDSSAAPTVDDRVLGLQPPAASLVFGLVRRLGVEDRLGTSVEALEPVPGGSARVHYLYELQSPRTDAAPLGVVAGVVDNGPPRESTALIAVDDTIVTAALVDASGQFATLLPPDALSANGNDIRVVLVDGDAASELTLRS
jgi:hypothetical protein